ncbi:AAA family ATPase [Bradyrhizobium sp. HKCCYLS2038]|uniref:AAA family ATPase n=1 Tax=unclassified Bradyrhizobium TaxID=2631580 RepID=UPI003EBF4A2A
MSKDSDDARKTLEDVLTLLSEDRLESAPPPKKDDDTMTEAALTPLKLLHARNWEFAFTWLVRETNRRHPGDEYLGSVVLRAQNHASDDHPHMKVAIDTIVDRLLDIAAGHLAVAWQMLQVRPSLPGSFVRVMPPLARLAAVLGSDKQREILKVWWAGAEGKLADQKVSMFAIAKLVIDGSPVATEALRPLSSFMHTPIKPTRREPPANHVVVMPNEPADEKLPPAWKKLVGEPLPLIICKDVAGVRTMLHREFPHATHVVDTLLRGVADGRAVRLTLSILVGPPGGGKSRLARRVAEALGLSVHRQDAAACLDGTFGGSSKTWSTAQPSVPARAVLSSRTANPMVLIDEIEKAGSGSYNGRLWDALVPFLERETSSRYRENALDCELDLGWVSFIATANSTEGLPGPLLDRFRILRVPAPTLAHLPALAAQVMRDLAREEDHQHDAPLAGDELEVIAKAWAREKFSLRKLQRLVIATLEVRDQMAPRH